MAASFAVRSERNIGEESRSSIVGPVVVAILVVAAIFGYLAHFDSVAEKDQRAKSATMSSLVLEADSSAQIIPDSITFLGQNNASAKVSFSSGYKECQFPNFEKMVCAS